MGGYCLLLSTFCEILMEAIVYALNKPMPSRAKHRGPRDEHRRYSLGRQLTKYVAQWLMGKQQVGWGGTA